MKTILEIGSRQEVRYEMPDEVFDLVTDLLRHRLAKTVKRAVAMLPAELAAQVTAEPQKRQEPVRLRGWQANVMVLDDFAFFDGKYREWKQFWPPEPSEGWSVPDRPIFPDRSKEPDELSP